MWDYLMLIRFFEFQIVGSKKRPCGKTSEDSLAKKRQKAPLTESINKP